MNPAEIQQLLDHWHRRSLDFIENSAPRIVLDVVVAIILIWLLRRLTHRLVLYTKRESIRLTGRAQQLRTVASVINSVGLALIVFWAFFEVLERLGINIGPLLASAGVAGLAIGFGAQTLVKDVINGFFILMENQYDLGDVIRTGGVKGTVESMTLRRTVLRDTDGSLHVIPNSEIKIVSNLTRDWAQVSLHVAVAYNEPSERVIALLEEIGREVRNDERFLDAVVADPEVPGIERVAAGEVDYLMLVKTRPSEQFRVQREIRRRIKEAFEKNNIQPARPAHVFVIDAEGGRPT
jgi:moderate conductance mechanosensitive channel